MMQELVSLMNVKIEETIRNIPPHMIESNKYPYVKATDLIEFQAFLGLLLFRGMYNLNNHSIDILFQTKMVCLLLVQQCPEIASSFSSEIYVLMIVEHVKSAGVMIDLPQYGICSRNVMVTLENVWFQMIS